MTYQAGDVVVVPFPYTDLTSSKQRPALVVSPRWYNDASRDGLFAYVTSVEQPDDDPFSVSVTSEDLASGRLAKDSWVRTEKLFTLEQSIVRKAVGRLSEETFTAIRERIRAFVDGKNP